MSVLCRGCPSHFSHGPPLGTLAIASAANDDVTAWCLLAVVIAISKAGSFASALYSVGLAVAYIAVMFLVVRPFLKKVGEVYANKEAINKTFVAFILLILIISSCLTEIIGIHALFGAFMAGVVMPSNLGFRKVMMEKVEDISLVFFLPLFFTFTGLRMTGNISNNRLEDTFREHIDIIIPCLQKDWDTAVEKLLYHLDESKRSTFKLLPLIRSNAH